MSTLRKDLSEGQKKVVQAVGGKFNAIIAAEVECFFLDQKKPDLNKDQADFLRISATTYKVTLPDFAFV